MKTKVSDTSINNYYNYPIKGEKENSELKRVTDCIKSKNTALSGRQISQFTGIENSAVARTLNNLKKSQESGLNQEIQVLKDKCLITGITVQHYKHIKINKDNQITLFN